jgi:hypothetical protein
MDFWPPEGLGLGLEIMVNELVLPHFLTAFCSMGSKRDKITGIFDKVEHIKNWGVTHWAEKNGLTVIQIISS